MKRVNLLLVVLLMVRGMAMTQGPRRGDQNLDPKERAERMTERIAKEYSLSETQKRQLLEANMTLMEKMETCPGKMELEMGWGRGEQNQTTDSCTCRRDEGEAPRMSREDREKMRQEMKASCGAYDASLKKVMTKKQYETYTKQKAGRGPRGGGRK